MASPSGSHGEERAKLPVRRGVHIRPVNFLLLIPLIGTLFPMIYNQDHPRLGGMPFFYWYQLLWVPISVVITYAVYRTTRGER
ncbi:MAG: hypothetical protein QOE24_905 [Frankiales bacterium]|nr:hypothetical protein [Frankiales bacterium]